MKKISIHYIGNNLVKSGNNITTIETLSLLLESEGLDITKVSNKKNKLFRLLDMCFSVIKYRKVDYLLIDTYSTTNFYYAFITSQLARLFNLKYIPILHGGNLINRLNESVFLSKLIFSNSYINVSPSNYLKEIFNNKGYQTLVIPNVIDIEQYTFTSRTKILPNILFVRAFAKIYNPFMAIQVINELVKQYPSAKLCMIGPDKEGMLNEVKELVNQYGLHDNVEFTGLLSKKEWHKKSNDYSIFINTSNVDNMPVSVIEAMALGLTVVSTNVGGMPYLIKDKVDGMLVEKDAAKQMTQEIIFLLENNNKQIAVKAREKVEQFTWSQVKIKWLELLR